MKKPLITLICAMSPQRVIGDHGRMPWHLPAELALFKKMTLGKPVLMGRRTFISIGHALPGRRNLVLSRQNDLCLKGCDVFYSLESALAAVSCRNEELMVIGGATLYQQTLPLAHRLHLTFVDCELPGDTYFPEWNPAQWRELQSDCYPADSRNCFSFRSVQLERII